ncbi:CaiB/BaiF CoA transferase family protein [Aquisalibacillus elongatus]|uniref:Crotonobetainyl-CoA:carnitine CoA-transferase CaiB-like acyl-CoA transferase n=1 Tax=Aquisalibacillus elongatus TaxID=485577 RepID=A0A3N5B0F8_9BACI|nr:CoA transferase [Aquisalibacillus elongatus]RPF51046.1 crotonobetainyl-CoA:carnitine CoA-transferase CaiB-like acyl-CoA transferase [Aquisalibacillus elongatus]
MLEGIRVIDFSLYLPGPYATLRLADFGAEVVKIEPSKGDQIRQMANETLFAANNRGKKSVALDLKLESEKEKALELIKTADVVVESFRPGVMGRLGLGYDDVREINPNIIYLSLTGFGQNSSLSHRGSHDLNYLAMSGMLSQIKDDKGQPVQPTHTMADLIGGMVASETILANLLKRERTGSGTYIDLAITDAVFSMMENHMMLSTVANVGTGIPVLNGSYANYRIYETKDQQFVSLGALEYKFWNNFCLAVGQEDWLDHFPDQLKTPKVIKQLEQLFKTRTKAEWTTIGEEQDCCLFPVLEIDEVLKSDYINERGLLHQEDNLSYVQTHYDSKATRFDVAELAEHNRMITKDPN